MLYDLLYLLLRRFYHLFLLKYKVPFKIPLIISLEIFKHLTASLLYSGILLNDVKGDQKLKALLSDGPLSLVSTPKTGDSF